MDLVPVPNVAFASTACFSCYRAPPDTTPLSRCSGCKRIKFCSKQCSVKEWTDHKPFCRAFGTLRKRPNSTLPPMYENASVSARRETHRAQFALEDELLCVALARQPTMLESKLLWREPRCGVCWDREADVEGRDSKGEGETWRVCKGCRIMAWCSEAHENESEEEHRLNKGDEGKTQCELFRLSNEIDELHLRHAIAVGGEGPPPSLWVPSRILSTPTALPPSWEDYLIQAQVPPQCSQAEIYGVFLEALSPVLTILASLRRLFPSSTIDSASTLRLIFLSETHQTLSSILPAFEELQHQLPSLRNLELISHSLPPPSGAQPPKPRTITLPLCPRCTKEDRKRSITTHQGTWPEIDLQIPTLAISLNSTFFQSTLDETAPDYYAPALKHLFEHRVKVLFTGSTDEETNDDLSAVRDVFEKQKIEVEWEVERNLWSGGSPRLDGWNEDGYWKKNGFTFAVGPRL